MLKSSWIRLALGCLLAGCSSPDTTGSDGDAGVGPNGDASLDHNECDIDLADCGPHATCETGPNGTVCVCSKGFAGAKGACVDVNECEEQDDACGVHASCTNTEGAHECVCATGFSSDGSTCVDIDECADGTAVCASDMTCMNVEGGYQCRCKDGLAGDDVGCVDVDECAEGTAECDPHATCENTIGRYLCTCEAGYSGDGATCDDVDECADGTASCDPHALCTNVPGSSICTCEPGYLGDGATCVRLEECAFDEIDETSPLTVGCGAGSYATIQAAVDAAASGQLVSVCAGTYHEEVSIVNKTLRVRGAGSALTFVDPEGIGSAFTIEGSGAEAVYLEAMTIEHSGDRGIVATSAYLIVANAVVSANAGGGVKATWSSAPPCLCQVSILGSSIADNTSFGNPVTEGSGAGGGGVWVQHCDVLVRGSVVRGNRAITGTDAGYGGGIYVRGSARIVDSSVLDNAVFYDGPGGGKVGGGIYVYLGHLEILGSDIAGNGIYPSDGGVDATSLGGGAYVEVGEDFPYVLINDSKLVGNVGDLGGGLAFARGFGGGFDVATHPAYVEVTGSDLGEGAADNPGNDLYLSAGAAINYEADASATFYCQNLECFAGACTVGCPPHAACTEGAACMSGACVDGRCTLP